MSRWQAKLEQKQAVLGRIVDIGAELYAISAAAVYAQTLREEHPERGDEAVELADLFIRQARRRVDALFGELFSNDDDANYKLAQQVLEGRHTWLEEGIADPSGDGPMIAEQPPEVSRARLSGHTCPQGSAGSTGGLKTCPEPRAVRALRSAGEGGRPSTGRPSSARTEFQELVHDAAARSSCRRRSSSSSARSAICCWWRSPRTSWAGRSSTGCPFAWLAARHARCC